jgi:hypothetical protein
MPHTWGRLSSVFAMRTRTGLSVGRGGQVRSVGSVWATECRVGKLRTFLEYTHSLNWYMPAGMIPPLGVIATGAETLFGLLLLVGWHTRAAAHRTSSRSMSRFGRTTTIGHRLWPGGALGWDPPSWSEADDCSLHPWLPVVRPHTPGDRRVDRICIETRSIWE